MLTHHDQLEPGYRAALGFVNRVRRRFADEPLGSLPPGRPGDVDRCPIACAIGHGAAVDGDRLYSAGRVILMPDEVCGFVEDFDRGYYRSLLEERALVEAA